MASVYKRTYRKPDGRAAACDKYTVECKVGDRFVRLPGYRDKRASEELGRKVERVAALRESREQPDATLVGWLEGLPAKLRDRLARLGLLDPHAVGAGRALAEHVADYERALLDRGVTTKHATLVKNRVDAILTGIGAKHLSDVTGERVGRYLADRRRNGLSVQSSNHYLRAVKGLVAWLVKERRASESPIAHLPMMNPRIDRRHERRALGTDELRRLLNATRNGPERFGMLGAERAMLYELAVTTGLRASELRSLTRSSFDFDRREVTVEAAYSKRRRDDVLPLRAEVAERLRALLTCKLPGAPAFDMPKVDKLSRMVKADLTAAGVPYADGAGRVADFHALRHTFITNLARGGVHPRTAQELARHSTIKLTMDRYSHVARGALDDALRVLPDLSGAASGDRRATGTDDAGACAKRLDKKMFVARRASAAGWVV
jgi:integrase/recombinase XerD